MTPSGLHEKVIAERVAWIAQMLHDLLTGRLVDIERLTATLTRWVAAHPELVDRSL